MCWSITCIFRLTTEPVKQCSRSGAVSIGPPGSGSVSQRNGSGSSHHQAKKVRKPLIFTVLWLLYYVLYTKNDVNEPSKVKSKFFCWILKSLTKRTGSGAGRSSEPDPLVRGTDPRIRIRSKMLRIRKTAVKFNFLCCSLN